MRIDNLSSSMGTVVATGWEPSGLSDAEVEDGKGTDSSYRSHCIYGTHRLSDVLRLYPCKDFRISSFRSSQENSPLVPGSLPKWPPEVVKE